MNLQEMKKRKNQINQEEKMVLGFLQQQGFTNIIYEPDPNTTPDLLVNDTIGVEVRRLNKNHRPGDKLVGLEQYQNIIWEKLKWLVSRYPIKNNEYCSFIRIGYNEELSLQIKDKKKKNISIKNFIKKIKHLLDSYTDKTDQFAEFNIGELGISISFNPIKRNEKSTTLYQIGIITDERESGFVVPQFHQNIKWVIEEKERKIDEKRSKYSVWWLAVVDTIGYYLSDEEIEQFLEMENINTVFDKIIHLSPIDKNYCKVIDLNKRLYHKMLT